MKKTIVFVFIIAIFLSLMACGRTEETPSADISATSTEEIYFLGKKQMKLLKERKSFLTILLEAEEESDLKNLFNTYINCDLDNPNTIYKITINESLVQEEIAKQSYFDWNDIPESLRQAYLNGLMSFSQYNMLFLQKYMSSVNVGIFNPIFTATTSFVYKGLRQVESYLYTYYDSFPVQIFFYPGDDDTVYVTLSVILTEDFPAFIKNFKERFNITNELSFEEIDIK